MICSDLEIFEYPKYGVVLKCHNMELADKLDDFLTEDCFVLFQTKFDPEEVLFFFGQASSHEKVKGLIDQFILSI